MTLKNVFVFLVVILFIAYIGAAHFMANLTFNGLPKQVADGMAVDVWNAFSGDLADKLRFPGIRFLDKDGRILDEDGRILDEHGRILDEDGNISVLIESDDIEFNEVRRVFDFTPGFKLLDFKWTQLKDLSDHRGGKSAEERGVRRKLWPEPIR